MSPCSRLLLLVFATLALLGAPHARSAVLADDGALARWVDGSLAPELMSTLARHPRFRGETFDFVALQAGTPQPDSSELYRALVQRLRQQLLRVDGIRLLAPRLADACSSGGAAASADLLLGIEISAGAGPEARVSLAVLDVAEAVWVSGVSHAWTGRLSETERAALAVRTLTAVPGSVTSPFAEADTGRIAAALGAQLECARPGGIDGTTYLGAPATGIDARIAGALRTALAVTPRVVLSNSAADADWRLEVRSGQDRSGKAVRGGAALQELQLLLIEARSGAMQQVAGVFVTGAPTNVVRAPVPPSSRTRPVAPQSAWTPPQTEPAQLLGALQLRQVAPTGICSDPWGRIRACAEVSVELLAPGHLFVVTTRDGVAQPLSCAARPERSSAGERVFRFEVEDLRGGEQRRSTAADAGIYVLAAADRGVAAELAKALQTAPGACGTPARRSTVAWIDALASLLVRYPGQIHWRALHVVRDEARIVRL